MKLQCLVTSRGTYCSETALCDKCLTPKNQYRVVKQASRDVQLDAWHDCVGNDAVKCTDCGCKMLNWEHIFNDEISRTVHVKIIANEIVDIQWTDGRSLMPANYKDVLESIEQNRDCWATSGE